MKIRYVLTRFDLFKGRILMVACNRRIRAVFLLLGAFVAFSSWRYSGSANHEASYRVIYTLVELGFVFGASALILVVFSAVTSFTGKGEGLLGEHTIILRRDGLEEVTSLNRSVHLWTNAFRVERGLGVWLFFVGDGLAHIVPGKSPILEGSVEDFAAEFYAQTSTGSG